MCESCKELRNTFYLALNRYNSSKQANDGLRENMVKCRNKYVANSRRCRKDFDRLQINKLLKSECENVKEYWIMLNKSNKVAKKPEFTDNDFFDHLNR